MERLRLIEAQSVGCSELISVLILLSSPSGAIPVLSVHGIATTESAQSFFSEMGVLAEARLAFDCCEFEIPRIIELCRLVSFTEVWFRLNLWCRERSTSGRREVVFRVVVRMRDVHSL